MNTPDLPTNLTVLAHRRAHRPVPIAGPRHRTRAAHSSEVLDRDALLESTHRIGSLARRAPLSFVVVHVDGLQTLHTDDAELLMRLVSGRIRALTRATDVVGRLGPASFGVLLQGTGASAAAALAARLSHHLSKNVRGTSPLLSVQVGAATGTGANWETLPVAAGDGLEHPA